MPKILAYFTAKKNETKQNEKVKFKYAEAGKKERISFDGTERHGASQLTHDLNE